MEPRNRKQRRTAAASSAEADIPLSHPPRRDTNTPSTKTLYDIIADRQKELLGQDNGPSIASAAAADKDAVSAAPRGTRFVTVDVSGAVVDVDGTSSNGDENTYTTDDNNTDNTDNNSNADHTDDKPLPPFLDTILLSIPLTTLHLTLAYLAAHQYAEKTDARQLLKDSLTITLPPPNLPRTPGPRPHRVLADPSATAQSRQFKGSTTPGFLCLFLIRAVSATPTRLAADAAHARFFARGGLARGAADHHHEWRPVLRGHEEGAGGRHAVDLVYFGDVVWGGGAGCVGAVGLGGLVDEVWDFLS
ncbi:hypothetical protein NUU61_004056 [Penicillium alfredii]|uniref:Uncharacterized protein n=1 Tax=Penicillium alfredii TaxID=1506179 RepID=A0A9W9KD02_9EURO|nr:uncharacterized protein NUU61_004056 [Penicillium alfredii]KAJ5101834.1 hypothetical protein NUU61_004056 [Penicillium alfredii]